MHAADLRGISACIHVAVVAAAAAEAARSSLCVRTEQQSSH